MFDWRSAVNRSHSTRTALAVLIVLSFLGCAAKPEITPQQESGDKAVDSISHSTDTGPTNTEALKIFMDGQYFMNQGDFARAIIEFQDALLLDSGVSTIHVSLAECYWNIGKMNRAMYHINAALKLNPKDTDALEQLAQYYILAKKFNQAEKEFRTLLEIKPDNPEYLYALADLAKLQERYPEAIALYEKVYRLDPEAVVALEVAAKLAISIKSFKKAEALYQELCGQDSNNPAAWHIYANLAFLNNHNENGLAALQRLNDLNPGDAETVGRLGAILYEAGRLDSAGHFFEEALLIDSTNFVSYHFLATIYREKGDQEAAINISREMIKRFPSQSQGYIDGALAYLETDLYQQTIELLTTVTDSFPNDFAIQFLLGSCYHQLNQSEEAITFLERAVAINSESKSGLHALALAYDAVQRWQDSDRIYERLIQKDSTDAQAYNNYAYSLIERGEKLQYALKLSEISNRLAPDNAAYLDTIGWAYFMLGNFESARNYIDRSLGLDSSNAVVIEHSGDVYVKINQPENARSSYQQALDLDPDNERLKNKLSEF